MEYGLREITGFSMISGAQLDNLVERFMSDRRKMGGLVGSWDLMMRKGGAQKILNEYCTVLNQYFDCECERI